MSISTRVNQLIQERPERWQRRKRMPPPAIRPAVLGQKGAGFAGLEPTYDEVSEPEPPAALSAESTTTLSPTEPDQNSTGQISARVRYAPGT